MLFKKVYQLSNFTDSLKHYYMEKGVVNVCVYVVTTFPLDASNRREF